MQQNPQAAILGRFTTNPGLVWAEWLADYYGTDASPNGNGQSGDNYAAGGATVATDRLGPPFGLTPSLATQASAYLSANGGRADPDALYTVWGGANDLFAIAANPAQAQQIIVNNGLAVPLRYDHMIVAMHDYVKGWAMNDLGFQPRLYDVWLDQ